MHTVYLDNAATTALKPQVLEAMLPYLQEAYGNASALYQLGRRSKQAIETAREQIAAALGAAPAEIYFTASGTEANNWALQGLARAHQHRGKHIITSAIEHHAVLHACQFLQRQGFEVTYLPVDQHGLVSPAAVAAALRPDTILLSLMWANNEVGTLQPLTELAALAAEHQLILHTDAVQAVGKIALDLQQTPVSALSFSGHKFHGPKGVGALYLRRGLAIEPLLHGGAQERDLRAGTENVAGIVGMARALELAVAELEQTQQRVQQLRDSCQARLQELIPDIQFNGHPTQRLAGHLNLSLPQLAGDELLLMLDMRGIAASSGSACSALSIEPSHVLKAMGVSDAAAGSALRLTFGSDNNMADVDRVVEALVDIVRSKQ